MKLKLISCEIFYREICTVVAKSKNLVDIEFMPKSLHDIGCENMYDRIQASLSKADDEDYDYILLAYGLCNNGTLNLKTSKTPFVIPRTHDCIALLMGDKKLYKQYFDEHSGSLYLSTGWIERSSIDEQSSIQSQLGMNKTMEELIEEYGEDEAEYLYETLCVQINNYTELTYIKTGVEVDSSFETHAKKDASDRGLQYKTFDGNVSLLQKLVNGEWDEEDFMLINPKEVLSPSYKDDIFKAKSDVDNK